LEEAVAAMKTPLLSEAEMAILRKAVVANQYEQHR
jgi:hypothetical protein